MAEWPSTIEPVHIMVTRIRPAALVKHSRTQASWFELWWGNCCNSFFVAVLRKVSVAFTVVINAAVIRQKVGSCHDARAVPNRVAPRHISGTPVVP